MRSHYAPRTPVHVVDAAELQAELARDLAAGCQVAVLAQGPLAVPRPGLTWIDAGSDADVYAHDLYANLRTLDKAGAARILVAAVPVGEAWDAVRDRLSRAAAQDAADAADST